MVSTPSGFDMSGRSPVLRGTVGGGPDDNDELAAAPGRFESDVQAASATDAAEPMRKLRRERAMGDFLAPVPFRRNEEGWPVGLVVRR
jgi:hypothetical protein